MYNFRLIERLSSPQWKMVFTFTLHMTLRIKKKVCGNDLLQNYEGNTKCGEKSILRTHKDLNPTGKKVGIIVK